MNRVKTIIARILLLIIPNLAWYLEFRHSNRTSLISEGIIMKLWAFRKGFFLESIKLCGITKENVHEYLSDKAYLKLHPINKEYSNIIDNKLYLPFILKDYPEIVPTYYYLVEKGRLVKIDNGLPDDLGLIQLCKEKLRLALKPCNRSFGEGFYMMEFNNNTYFLNNKPIEIPELSSFIESLDSYLVTEYIQQNKYAAEINQSSVNTIRLICVRDSINNEFFIPISNHRFGVDGKFVDNIGAEGGGIAAYIDIASGKIKNIGCIKVNKELIRSNKVIMHPDSNKQITGIIIPNWTEMINKVLVIMNHLSFLKYAGLDIVITENGFKILEINSLPTLLGLQIEDGVLKNDRLKRFFNAN